MFKLTDHTGAEILVKADRWVAGITGVTFTDERGKVTDFYEWNEIGDTNIEVVNG